MPSIKQNGLRRERRKAERRAARRRERQIERLTKRGAKHIADANTLQRNQQAMLARFANADVLPGNWKRLVRCRSGRCARKQCSAACWFGDRGKANQLMLEASRLLKATDRELHYVTIIDPHYAAFTGDLSKIHVSSILASLRRRFRQAADLFSNDPAFGFIEVAMESLPDGRSVWFAHIHLVLASNVQRTKIREALQPRRALPNPADWGRKRWKPVVVKPVADLANLLAYNSKRIPEENITRVDSDGKRRRFSRRMQLEHRLEHDLWLLTQRPADRVFKRRMKEVHGKLAAFTLKS